MAPEAQEPSKVSPNFLLNILAILRCFPPPRSPPRSAKMVAAASANMPKHEGGEGKWTHLPAECWENIIKIKILSQSRNPLHKGSRERKDYHCPIIIKQGHDVPHRQSDKRLQRLRESHLPPTEPGRYNPFQTGSQEKQTRALKSEDLLPTVHLMLTWKLRCPSVLVHRMHTIGIYTNFSCLWDSR